MNKCPLCSKTFRQPANLKAHIVCHTKEKPYKCNICAATFGRSCGVRKHIRSVHHGSEQIKFKNSQCPMCSYKCYNKTDVRIHLQNHSAQRPFSCNVPSCGFKSKYKQALSLHVRQVHSDARPYECPIDGCNYKAKISGTLRVHLQAHSSEKPFVCTKPGCNYTCKFKRGLKAHTSQAHSNERPFKCSICAFQTKNSSNFNRHQLTHTTIKRFHCRAPNCGYACHERGTLKRHFDSKHRKKTILCTQPGCKFRYGSIAVLRAHHLKSHESPMLKCPAYLCDFSSKYKDSLLAHISRHHQDLRPPTVVAPRIPDLQKDGVMDTFKCSLPDCGYQTKFPHLYGRHIKTHKKEENRQHVCSFCFLRFSYTRQLKDHLRRHVGEKPYSCSHCCYTSHDIFELRKHAIRSHHIRVIPRGKEVEAKQCWTCARNGLSNSELVLHSMTHLQPVVLLERLCINFK